MFVKGKIDFYLLFSLSLLIFINFEINSGSSIWFLKKERIYETLGYFSLIEFIQLIFLFLTLLITLKNRALINNYFKYNNIFTLRVIIPIILIFEETSYYFKSLFKNIDLSAFNGQAEFNFHNLLFLDTKVFQNFPILGNNGLTSDISIKVILFSSLCIIFGFGGFLNFLGKIKFLFFEKRFLFYVMIYIINIIFSYILRFFQVINTEILENELMEIFYYQLLFIDIQYKIKAIEHT